MLLVESVELLECVFKYLDGRTLARARSVCRLWKEELDRMFSLPDSQLWQRCCRREIVFTDLLDILERNRLTLHTQLVRPEGLVLMKNVDWFKVYVVWCNWKTFGNWSDNIRQRTLVTVDSTRNIVTACQLSGSFLVTGHETGHVQVHSIASSQLFCRKKIHSMRINCIKLLQINKDLKYVDGLERIFPEAANEEGFGHDCMVTTSGDLRVRLTLLSGHMLIPSIHVPEDDFVPSLFPSTSVCLLDTRKLCVLTEGGNAYLWYIENSSRFTGDLKLVFHQILPFQCVAIGHFIPNKIIRVVPVEDKDYCKSVYVGGQPSVILKETIHNSASIFLSRNTFIWVQRSRLEGEPQLFIRVLDVSLRRYELAATLNAIPTCCLRHGRLLFFGLDSGWVVMYYVETDADLLRLQLESPTWSHYFFDTPVSGIEMKESTDTMQIFAFTDSQVAVVTAEL